MQGSDSDATTPAGRSPASHPSAARPSGSQPAADRPSTCVWAVLPDVTTDERDLGWGELPEPDDDDRYLREVPPHHGS